MLSNMVNGSSLVQTQVVLVKLAVWSFPCFPPKPRVSTGKDPLKDPPTEGIPPPPAKDYSGGSNWQPFAPMWRMSRLVSIAALANKFPFNLLSMSLFNFMIFKMLKSLLQNKARSICTIQKHSGHLTEKYLVY